MKPDVTKQFVPIVWVNVRLEGLNRKIDFNFYTKHCARRRHPL